MDDHSDLYSLVLRLLDRYDEHGAEPGQGPTTEDHHHHLATIHVSGATYRVTSAEVDLLLQQSDGDDGRAQAARLILRLAPGPSAEQEEDPGRRGQQQQPAPTSSAEVAAHVLVRRPAGGAPPLPAHVDVILDADAIAALPGGHGGGAAQRASLLPTTTTARTTDGGDGSPIPAGQQQQQQQQQQQSGSAAPPRPQSGSSLADTYGAYIDAINARALARALPGFCHPTVTHNGRALALAAYRRLMEDAQDAIRGLSFGVADLLVDEARGVVAARLAFRGVAVGEFAGVRPAEGEGAEVVGREVRFGEIVFYWFEGGRIKEVVSLVDLDAYRAQVRG